MRLHYQISNSDLIHCDISQSEFRLNVYTDTIYDRLKILEDAKHLNMDLHGSLHRTLQGRWPVRTKVVVAMGLTLLLVAWIVRLVGFFVYHV